MLIQETLFRDPSKEGLINNGQARIANELSDENVKRELRGELATFVCEGQYAEGIISILTSFLAGRSLTNQKAAWISGFFGSGKSHLLKMLSHLWVDTGFSDGVSARSLVPELPEEVRNLLRELDTTGKRSGGLLAAAGTMPGGNTENVRLTVLGILLRACNLPMQYHQAQFLLWLEERGIYDSVAGSVRAAGKELEREINNLYVSPLLAKAILSEDPNFATSEASAKEILKAQFPKRTSDITTDEFLEMARQVLSRAGKGGQLPCAVLILDEVQQYIGDSETRSVVFTELAEAISKELDSQVILVAAGQNALSGIPKLQKLLDRFTIRIQLSDADVETVTRKVLLRKKPSALAPIEDVLRAHAGEVSRQLQGTKIAERPDDRSIIVSDYPLLPVRRRFWEHCFRMVDTAGTQSQLRSQLRIVHDCVAEIAHKPLGCLIPADELYEALAPEMVTTNALPREINERIIGLGKDGTKEGRLRQRICGLVFLIGQRPADAVGDIGVRATKEHIADLLVEDLRADNGKLRADVAIQLEQLADSGVLMRVGEEFRIQTEEGRNWEHEFRQREAKLRNDAAFFDEKRDQLLAAEVQKSIDRVKVLQGAAKEHRELKVFRSNDVPQSDGEFIPVWIRDGFNASEKDVLAAARTAGVNSPTIFIFIPRTQRDDLASAVATEYASEQTLSSRGVPAASEGQVARQSMESRYLSAKSKREQLIADIVSGTRVFQGGGNELLQLVLEEKIRVASDASAARLFPQFKDADYPGAAWGSVIKRAKDGADQPLSSVNYTGPIEQHPVCRQVLTVIGSGKAGTQIRKELGANPYGWPQDAIDAALIALHRSQHITGTLNGVALPLGQLDQNKIAKTEFRVETITLSVQERNAIRALFQDVGIKAKGDELDAKVPEFFTAAIALAEEAGGDQPEPKRPDVADIQDIQRLAGNERLAALSAKAPYVKERIATWKSTRDLIAKRLPEWQTLKRLAIHAEQLRPASASLLDQRDAIANQRLLLANPNPVNALRAKLSDFLRQALNEAQSVFAAAYENACKTLDANSDWQQLSEADRQRVLSDVSLQPPPKPDVSSDMALLGSLDSKSITVRKTETEAIPSRLTAALQQAAKILEPKVQFVHIERRVLRTTEEVETWVGEQKQQLIAALKDGPVQIQ
jgi:hypothetical protein